MNKEDYNKYYIQGSDHYLIPKDVFKELFNEMVNWKEDSQKQKEAIDKAIEFIYAHSSMQPPYYEFREFYNVSNLSELLDILKEVE